MLNLSFVLSKKTPLYGGIGSVRIEQVSRMSRGDSCNTLELCMSNHAGTHIDMPRHFDPDGKGLTDYESGFWFTRHVCCLSMDVTPNPKMMITGRMIDRILKSNSPDYSCIEAVLLKTGMGRFRNQLYYWKNPPGIDPAVPDYLRERFPKLKFFGVDLISISSFANREAGRLAHKAFLKHDRPILPIEDMNLLHMPEAVSNLLVSPLMIQGADGAPCNVFANIGI